MILVLSHLLFPSLPPPSSILVFGASWTRTQDGIPGSRCGLYLSIMLIKKTICFAPQPLCILRQAFRCLPRLTTYSSSSSPLYSLSCFSFRSCSNYCFYYSCLLSCPRRITLPPSTRSRPLPSFITVVFLVFLLIFLVFVLLLFHSSL